MSPDPSTVAARSSESPTPSSASPLSSLDGRVVLISGGAGGLGSAIARTLGEAGARVVLADIDAERTRRRAEELSAEGLAARALLLDVGDAAQCERAVAAVGEEFGRLDVLVNNAAIDVTAPLAELAVEDWRRVLAVNLFGALVLAKHASALMQRRGQGGHLINIASTASKRAWPNASAYHATKWGLLGLSHALHAELRPQRIRVCAIVAGGMRTPFLLDRFPGIDLDKLQEPVHVARAVRYVLEQPEGTCVAEMTVLPEQETSWP
ncbi:SDR family oxidoreductase [Roseateles violae]|uniref:SDR family oxidoreductase n=1 Tax=Roseateles violae TaxID=3058042 RepID=A0ABT8DYD7_9BURK|nr:SDR family oxidoreductase [Pelomonas sp. PFR6]MDN3922351.1 SDR family oxidoreductase [Pelomonas sp. PFR6]